MDTISVTLAFNRQLTENEIKKIDKHRFIEHMFISKANLSNHVFKISYPKFKGENNCVLIHDSEIILECNKAFGDIIKEVRPKDNISIRINRIDIPYTFYMENGEKFNDYKNIFYYMAYSFNYKNQKKAKNIAISDFLKEQVETILLSDSGKVKCGNYSIMIYNQYKKYLDVYSNGVGRIRKEHSDLPLRIRIEISKKINMNCMSLEKFMKLDLYALYNNNFIDFALEYLFNKDAINKLNMKRYKIWIKAFGKVTSENNYKYIIQSNLKLGDNYKVLRNALGVCKTGKTLEGAVTSIRKELKKYEIEKRFIIFDVDKKLELIKNKLESYKIKKV